MKETHEKPNPPSSEAAGSLAGLAAVLNSDMAQGCAVAMIILALLLGIGGCLYLDQTSRAQLEQVHGK